MRKRKNQVIFVSTALILYPISMKEINYTKAFEELQEIVHDIENGEISVDELSKKVKRAAELIKVCRTKLTSTEEDVNKILKELSSADEPDADIQ